jgi:hypothetical protein
LRSCFQIEEEGQPKALISDYFLSNDLSLDFQVWIESEKPAALPIWT